MNEFHTVMIKRLIQYRRIDPVTKCWIHTGALDKDGYGQIRIWSNQYRVHRLSAYLCLGLNLKDTQEFACHKCDNPPCWNPLHLFVGNNSDNQLDSVDKNTHPQTKKTHCIHGHEYIKENTYINMKTPGHRSCIICRNIITRSNYRNPRGVNHLKHILKNS